MDVDFALLAPVPREHLDSGIVVAQDKDYVCFGSNSWDPFNRMDGLRDSKDVPALFYPSHEDDPGPKATFKICYVGWYIGDVTSLPDKEQDDKDGHRPPSVDIHRANYDSPKHWAVFYRVRDLRCLPDPEQVSIGTLFTYPRGKRRIESPPRGPAVVARPRWFA